MVKVEILSLAGCCDTPATVDLVKNTAEVLGITINLSQIVINTQEEAEHFQFPGSPTVRLNGQDIEPAMRQTTSFGIT